MNSRDSILLEPWDVLIVGSGMGGATLARCLVHAGHRVLLLEKGGRIDARPPSAPEAVTGEERLAQGWWPNPVSVRHADGSTTRFHAPIGCAVGGSTVHYAAALERMAASDFAGIYSSRHAVRPWPVDHAEFTRYYEAAERLFGVGEPGAEAGRLSRWDQEFMAHMRRNGLKPDVLKVGIRYDDACTECIGRVCPRACKADARSTCIEAILDRPNFRLVEQCEVLRLEADSSQVTGVIVSYDGREIRATARMVVLAAGALHSPQILLRSAGPSWPHGLANGSGQVGRNLMFHTVDLFAVWAPRKFSRNGRQRKAVSIRDFYECDGRRLGYVQSMGLEAGQGVISVHLKSQLRRWGLRNELVLKLLVALPARLAARLLGTAVIFAGMTEDDPDPDNRLVLDPGEPDGTAITYTITDDLRARAEGLRAAFRRRLRPWRFMPVSAGVQMNHGHPCGTCRFGDDPATSVLDGNCRAHELENLYVVDASFFPRSGAVNPSLTIAANAIRVASAISAKLDPPESLVSGNDLPDRPDVSAGGGAAA